MLKGAIALVLRYILLVGGSALATAGVITATGAEHFCFNVRTVADAVATGVVMLLGGGASVVGGIGWRFWAKKRGGVT
uniref:Pam3-gp28 family putative phage holin n=1 Tax=Paracoccus sp. TRP TaxID=412597 RepID=UPI000225FC1D|nr:hypothetical protein [Paracoccus sp. TRP]